MDLDKNPEFSFVPVGHKYRPPRINDDLYQAKVPLWYPPPSPPPSSSSTTTTTDFSSGSTATVPKNDGMLIDDSISGTPTVTPRHAQSKTLSGNHPSVTTVNSTTTAITAKRVRTVPAPLVRLRDAYNDIKVPSALYGNKVQPAYTTRTVYSLQELQQYNISEKDLKDYLYFVKAFIHGNSSSTSSSGGTTGSATSISTRNISTIHPSNLTRTLSSYAVPSAYGVSTGISTENDHADCMAFTFLRKNKYNIERAKFLLVAFLGAGREHSALLRLNDISQGQFKFQHPEYVSDDEDMDEEVPNSNARTNGGSLLSTGTTNSNDKSASSSISLTNSGNGTVASSTTVSGSSVSSSSATTTTGGVRGGGDGLMDKGDQDDRGIKETPLGLGLDTGLTDIFTACDTATTSLAINHTNSSLASITVTEKTIQTNHHPTNDYTNQWKTWLTTTTAVLNSRVSLPWNKYIQLRSEALELYRITKDTNADPDKIDPEIVSTATKLGYRIRAIVRWRARIRDSLCDVLRLRGPLPLWRFEWLTAEIDNYKVELTESSIVQSIAKEGRTWYREAEDVLSRINASTKAFCAAELLFFEDDALAGPSGERERSTGGNTGNSTGGGDDTTGSATVVPEKTVEDKKLPSSKARSSGRPSNASKQATTETKESSDPAKSSSATSHSRVSATALVFTTRLAALNTAQQHAPPVSILEVSKLLHAAEDIPLGLAPLYQDLKLHLDRAVTLAQKVTEHFPYYLNHPKTITGNRTSQGYGLSRDLVGSKNIGTINFVDNGSIRNTDTSMEDGKTTIDTTDTNNNNVSGTGSMADGSSPYFPYATYYDMPLSSNISAINGTARRMRIPFSHIDALARDIRESGLSFYEGELLKIYHNEALNWIARSHELVSVKNRASIQALRELLAEADYLPIDLSERVAVLRYEIDRGVKWVDSVRVLLPKGAQRTRGGIESSKGATLPQILQKVEQVREGMVAAPMEDAEEAATLVQTVQEWINDVRYALEGSRSLKSLANATNVKNTVNSSTVEQMDQETEGENIDSKGDDDSNNTISLEFLSSLLRQADNIPIMMDEYSLLQAEVAARKWAMKAQKLLSMGSRLETLREHIKEIREIRSKVPDAGMPPLGLDGQMVRVDEEVLINRLIRNAEDWLSKSKNISTTAKGKHRVSLNRIKLLIDEGKALPVNMAVYIRPFEAILTSAEKWSAEAGPLLELVQKHKEKHKILMNFMQHAHERNSDTVNVEQQLEPYRHLPMISVSELKELVEQSADLNCVPDHEDELKMILKYGEQWIHQVRNLLPSLVSPEDAEEDNNKNIKGKGTKGTATAAKSFNIEDEGSLSTASHTNNETVKEAVPFVIPIEDIRELVRQGISLNINVDDYLQPILREYQKVREWQIRARSICSNLGIVNSPVLSTDILLDRALQLLGFIDTSTVWNFNDDSTNTDSSSISYTIDDALRMLEQIMRSANSLMFSTPELPILRRNLIVLRWIVSANRAVSFMDRYRDRLQQLLSVGSSLAGKNVDPNVSLSDETMEDSMANYPPISKVNIHTIPIAKYYQDISWENFLYRRLTDKAAEYGASYWIGNALENDDEIDKILREVYLKALDVTNDPDLQQLENKQKDQEGNEFITEAIPGKRVQRVYRTLHTADSNADSGVNSAVTSSGTDVTNFVPSSEALSLLETGEVSFHHRPTLPFVRELVAVAVDIGIQLQPFVNVTNIRNDAGQSSASQVSRSPVVVRSNRKSSRKNTRDNEIPNNDGKLIEDSVAVSTDTNATIEEENTDMINEDTSIIPHPLTVSHASSDIFSNYINSLSVKIKGLSNETCSLLYTRIHEELLNVDRWVREYQNSFTQGVTNIETALKLFSRGIHFTVSLPEVQRLWKYLYHGHTIFNQLMDVLPVNTLGKLSPSPSMFASITYGTHPNPEGKTYKTKKDSAIDPESNHLTNDIWRVRYGPHQVRQQNKSSRLRIRATRIFVNKKGEIVVRDGKMTTSSSGSNVLSSSNNDDEEIMETPSLPSDHTVPDDDDTMNTTLSTNRSSGEGIRRPSFKTLEGLISLSQNARVRLPIIRDIRGIVRIGHKWLEEVHHAGFEEGIATNDVLKSLLDSAEFVWVDISDVTDSIALASASTCVCDQPYAHPMVECPACTRLYHYDCVGFKLTSKSLRMDISQFRCPQCSAQEAISNQLYLCYQSLIRIYWGAQATWSSMPHAARPDPTIPGETNEPSVPPFPLRQLERAAQEAQQLQIYSFHNNSMVIPFMNLAAQYFNTKPVPLREITQIIEPIASLRRIYTTECMQWLDQVAEVYFPMNFIDGERYRTVAHIRTLIQNSLGQSWSMHTEINSLRNGLKILLWSQTCVPYMGKIFSLGNLEFILSSARATGIPDVSPIIQYLSSTYNRAHNWKHVTYNLLSAKGPLSDTILNDYNDHLKLSRFIPVDLSIDESRLEAIIVDGGKAWCLCEGLADGFMISCDDCEEWYHGKCVGIPKENDIPSPYQCPECCRSKDEPYPYRLEIGSATGIPSSLINNTSVPDRSTIMLRNLLNYTTMDFPTPNTYTQTPSNHPPSSSNGRNSSSSFQISPGVPQSSTILSSRGHGGTGSASTAVVSHSSNQSSGITDSTVTSSQPKPRGRKPQSVIPSTAVPTKVLSEEGPTDVPVSGTKRGRRKDQTPVPKDQTSVITLTPVPSIRHDEISSTTIETSSSSSSATPAEPSLTTTVTTMIHSSSTGGGPRKRTRRTTEAQESEA